MKFFILFLLMFSSLPAYEYELTVCAIFQNDSKYMPEWIEFHNRQGVEHFYLYNNRSMDDWERYLSPYVKSGLIEIINWPYTPTSIVEWIEIQCAAYNHAIIHFGKKMKWCAFIDTDEFLFSPEKSTLPEILKEFKHYGGVVVNWMMYGTSGIEKTDGYILDKLLYRAENSHICHKSLKSIVRPNKVIGCINPHFFFYKPGKYAVDENHNVVQSVTTDALSVNILRINHYWSRDKEFFETVKMKRNIRWDGDYSRWRSLERQFNEIYDPILKSD